MRHPLSRNALTNITMAINLYIVRHGETYFNFLHRFQGWSDAPLTPKGIQHGLDAGTRLARIHFDGAYSSDLTRAIHTARYILQNNTADSPKEPTQLFDFREQFFGSFEGVNGETVTTTLTAYKTEPFETYANLIATYGMADAMNTIQIADPFHFAEDDAQWWARVSHGFDDIRFRHKDGDNVLIVSHGTTIRGIAEKFARHDFASESVKNGAVMQLALEPDTASILRFNDVTTVF